MFVESRVDESLGFLPLNDDPLRTLHSCVVFPVIIKPIDARQGGCLLADWHNVWRQCFMSLLSFYPVHFRSVALSPPADHLSHLYILVLCASCTNSECL